MNLRPLHDWALIEQSDAGDITAGGIHIPDTAREKPAQGTVIAIGPGKYKPKKGKEKSKKKIFIPTSVVPGQHVMYAKYMATEVELDGEILTLVREEDILCTIEGMEKQLARAVTRDVLVPSAAAPEIAMPVKKNRSSAAGSKKKEAKSPSTKKKSKKKTVKTKKTAGKSTGTSRKKSTRTVSKKTAKKKQIRKKTTGKGVSRKKSVKAVKKTIKTKKIKKKR